MTKTNNKYASKQTGKVKNKPKQTKPSAAKHKNKAAKHNAETLRTRKQNQHIKQPNNQTNKPAKAHKEAAFCPVFEQCGACQMLNIPYSANNGGQRGTEYICPGFGLRMYPSLKQSYK